jgi:antitoxin VapB
MTKIAKVFKAGNSQAVRLPKEFRLNVNEVEISREGDALILRPKLRTPAKWDFLRAALERGVSADFLIDGREQPADQDRREIEEAFK